MADPEIDALKDSVKTLTDTMQEYIKNLNTLNTNTKSASGSTFIYKKTLLDSDLQTRLATLDEKKRNDVYNQTSKNFKQQQQYYINQVREGSISQTEANIKLKELNSQFVNTFNN